MTICIHSLWRSCSTYFALKFRKPELNTYWYYEPYNEIISRLTHDIAVGFNCDSWESRHPRMDDSYYMEYVPLINENGIGVRGSNLSFSFDQYFPSGSIGFEERNYLIGLESYAKSINKIPVFAFCRSQCRVGQQRHFLNALHIVQYRSPHEVLASCEDLRLHAQLLLSIRNIKQGSLPSRLGFGIDPSFCRHILSLKDSPLDFEYTQINPLLHAVFFEFYVISLFASIFYADIVVDINKLGKSIKYRNEIEDIIFDSSGLRVDFSDVSLPSKNISNIYNPDYLEIAIEKFVGNREKIKKFANHLENISGVDVVKSVDDIEQIRDFLIKNSPASNSIDNVKDCLNYANTLLTKSNSLRDDYENSCSKLKEMYDESRLKIENQKSYFENELSIANSRNIKVKIERDLFEESSKKLYQDYLRVQEQCALLQKKCDKFQNDLYLNIEKVSFLNKDLEIKANELTSFKELCSAKNCELAENFKKIDFLNKDIETKANELAALKELCAAQDTEIVENVPRLTCEVQKQQERIIALESSLSWRMTAPLRLLASFPLQIFRILQRKYIEKRYVPVVLKSGCFDNVFYMQNNPDVMLSGQDALTHFMLDGWKEGRNPSANFDISWYLQIYCDVRKSQINPLLHYVLYGRSEGRSAKRYTAVSQPESIYENSKISLSVAKRILVVDTVIPRPDVHAGELATFGILKTLCSVEFDVVYLPLNMEPNPPYEVPLSQMGVQSITRETSYCTPQQYVEAQGHTFGVFYIMRVESAEALLSIIRERAPHARVIYHSADLYFLREGRQAAIEKDPMLEEQANLSRERELRMMRESDLAVVVSPVERQILLEYLAPEKVTLFPVLYAPVSQNPAGYNERKDIFFIGGFNHTPNVDAVQWFVQDVWPLIHAQLPTVTFHIVGAQMPDSIKILGKERGVNIVGYVPDLQPLLETMRVGVAPLRYGAGIKGKVAVTMGAGIPCVCTSVASEGMWLTHGHQALIADDAQVFAEAVISLYQSTATWEAMSKRAHAHVVRYFGAEANGRSLLRVLRAAHGLPLDIYIAYCRSLQPRALPELAPGTSPDVSIIIPVYNQWDFTRDCINSVLEDIMASESLTVEIILADDGSTDETVNAQKYFPGLRVIKTDTNSGFLRNVNNAAKYAQGKYIVLLNNDTIVMPAWLISLYDSMQCDSQIGISGSKILNQNGTIQEAGSAQDDTGDGYNLGQGMPQYAHLFKISYSVDYLSGCSCCIRSDLWKTVSGFDERYKNAYCEDIDFSMTARSLGYLTLYIPESELVHFANVSYAENTKNNRPLHFNNISILRNKWEYLLSHYVPKQEARSEMPILVQKPYKFLLKSETKVTRKQQLRREKNKINVLFFSPFPSHPGNHGNTNSMQLLGKAMQSFGWKVHFVCTRSSLLTVQGEKEMVAQWDSVNFLPQSCVLHGRVEAEFDEWYGDGLGEEIYQLYKEYDIDIVYCTYIFHSKLLEYIPESVLKVIDTHDRMGNRAEMLKEHGLPLEFFSCSPEDEGRYLQRAHVVIGRRDEETEYFKGISKVPLCITVAPVDVPQYIEKQTAKDDMLHIGIVASSNRINLYACRDLLKECYLIHQNTNLSFVIHIVGQVKDMIQELPIDDQKFFSTELVELHGFVPDIKMFYESIDIVINPVEIGTGINIKTIEAMMFGMPILTTSCGSKGLETKCPQHHFKTLASLIEAAEDIAKDRTKLSELSGISRNIYNNFFVKNGQALFGLTENLCSLHVKSQKFENDSEDARITFFSNSNPDIAESFMELIYSCIVKNHDTVVDVGANHGRHTFPLARLVGKNGIVYAFDGIPSLCNDLKAQKFDSPVKIINAGVTSHEISQKNSSTCFYHMKNADEYSGIVVRPDMSTVDKNIEVLYIPTTTIDTELIDCQRVSFIKIDTGGGDFDVLRGAEQVLSEHKPVFVFEWGGDLIPQIYKGTREDFFSFFERIGYKLYKFTGGLYTKEMWNNPIYWELWGVHEESEWADYFESEYAFVLHAYMRNVQSSIK